MGERRVTKRHQKASRAATGHFPRNQRRRSKKKKAKGDNRFLCLYIYGHMNVKYAYVNFLTKHIQCPRTNLEVLRTARIPHVSHNNVQRCFSCGKNTHAKTNPTYIPSG
jgi:hypothetical protein